MPASTTTSDLERSDVDRRQSIDQLDDLLCAEHGAVECYEAAVRKFAQDPVTELPEVLRSHQTRIDVIRARLIGLGGSPSDCKGIRAAFTRLTHRLAQLPGRSSTINELEECEDRLLEQYDECLARMDRDTRAFAEEKLLAEQIRSHAMMRGVQQRCC